MRSSSFRASPPLLALLTALVGCSAEEADPVDVDDVDMFDPHDVPAADACMLVVFGAGPDDACVAEWACPLEGVLTLACGEIEDGTIVCACAQGEDSEPTVVEETPASCTDPVVLTELARESCGWSWL